MGKITAIANQKGGVGKTTSAINLAASLSMAGKRVLLIDTDPQGNSTSGLGIDKTTMESSLYDLYSGAKSIDEIILDTKLKNLKIISSNIELIGAELELSNREGRELLLKTSLATIRDRFDYIYIDCPPSLSLLTLNALVAADSLLIPMQCEFYALEGISMLMHTFELIKESFNPELEIEGILLTMFDNRVSLANQVKAELTNHFGDKVYKTVIPRNITLAEAPSHGKSVIQYDMRSKGAQSYWELAREILG
ncbi:MAG: ParA family protein [Nitrospira sp.]|nr:ParA family protein [bacterium]MBL7049298.1 ParA family protein [Nitrospira sp.]